MASTEYERGMLEAINLLKAVRERHEAPLRQVEVGAAYVALNAVKHWGQAITSDFETEVIKHLMAKKEDA
jgi:hypothetical protein